MSYGMGKGWKCKVCGCTDGCGCPEGCSWVAPNLCSSCEHTGKGKRIIRALIKKKRGKSK